jgi:hypothetical protein
LFSHETRRNFRRISVHELLEDLLLELDLSSPIKRLLEILPHFLS